MNLRKRLQRNVEALRMVVGQENYWKAIIVVIRVIFRRIRKRYLYPRWIRHNEPKEEALAQQRLRALLLPEHPLISLIIPVYNPPPVVFRETIESVIQQTYANWECCIANGDPNNSAITSIIDSYAKSDTRIKVKLLPQNLGIAGNTNEAIQLASGSYIGFLDHDDLLAPFSLFEIALRLCTEPDIDLFFSDEDIINSKGIRTDPFFKPGYSPDFLRSVNYMCHFLVVRKKIGDEIGWFREGYEGAQDFDFILRASEQAKRIERIPKILYHWRAIPSSTASDTGAKPYATPSGIRVVQDHIDRLNIPGSVEMGFRTTTYKVNYELTELPLVSIIILNHEHAEDLLKVIDSILEKSTYQNIELIVVENNSRSKEIFDLYHALENRDARIKILSWNSVFNYSRVNNWAAQQAKGSVLLFLNNDIEVITPDWIEQMLMHALRKDIGTVGAKLIFPNNTIQHAGVTIGIGDVAGHGLKGTYINSDGYFGFLKLVRNTTANTGACLMIRKGVFDQLGGFDEKFILAFGDLDLCLRALDNGFFNVWTPYAKLYHYESKTRGYEKLPEQIARYSNEFAYFRSKWDYYLFKGDPFYNPNLTLKKENFEISVKPNLPKTI